MAKLISVLFMALGVFSVASQSSAEPRAEITLALAGDRVEATYVFSEPVSHVVLPVGANGPDADIQISAADGLLEGGDLRTARPLTRITLSIGPDRRERDSIYPLASLLQGQGYVVYAPHLTPRGMSTHIRISGETEALSPAAADGYLLVGGALEDHGSLRMAVSAATPETFKVEAADRAAGLIGYYGEKMEREPARPPVVLLSYVTATSPTDPGRFRGDVSSNGVVFLRVRAGAQATEASILDRYTSFLAHEIFHLWNASRNPDRLDWWVHEGAAEYASWTAMNTLWPATTPKIEDRLTTALRSCAIYLGEKPLNGLSDMEARSVRYPCGAILQWVADLGARADGSGDVFSVWRRLAAERETHGLYTADTFLEALDTSAPAVAATARSIVEGHGVERWAGLAETANTLGADTVIGQPAAFSLRMNASRALVLSACGEVQGVGDGQDGLFVQAPQGCDAFGEMTFIDSADGVDPGKDAPAYYETVRAKCSAGGVVEVVVRNDGAVATKSVRCDVAVAPAPADIQVKRALPAA